MTTKNILERLKLELNSVTETILELNDAGVNLKVKVTGPTGSTYAVDLPAREKNASSVLFELVEANQNVNLIEETKEW